MKKVRRKEGTSSKSNGGEFSTEQIQEIALGLERSGQRFLWVVRNPSEIDDNSLPSSDSIDFDIEALMWEGYRGLVVKSWAPQVEVHINKVLLVEEMKLATPMEMAEEEGFVGAGEVEKRIKALMDLEEGREIREKCWEMRKKALVAWAEGGSSWTALSNLANSWTT
ncbi:hypothetical protein NE237_003607 [Protea cynaroides]|uniref:Uncharacterized protein n=1 Tax=Protea cynaroides TaxID=273540 RepID=A0A9Q0KH53_9MAGN|nr:hypothetical protein NE237_003607 [Protea cynaroides]